jgi:cob(I)alamin adenosyltransferase
VIGIAREHCALTENGLEDMLKEIQSRLFDLGAAVATPVQTSSSRKKAYTEVMDVKKFQLYSSSMIRSIMKNA